MTTANPPKDGPPPGANEEASSSNDADAVQPAAPQPSGGDDDNAVGEGEPQHETVGAEALTTAAPTKTLEDHIRPGFVRAGNQEMWVEARGRFDEAGLKGYAPSWDSEQILVEIPHFEGPLDLLLHLIAKHAMNILDIPVAKITAHYLGIIDDMRKLDLDIAGEFLVMAAKLAHIKSKMLLPKEDDEAGDEDEEDPRAALVRRLLEYQKFKDAAAHLGDRYWLGRDVFTRDPKHLPFRPDGYSDDDPLANLATFDVLKLLKLFDHISKRNKTKVVHQVFTERLSVGQRINELVDYVKTRDQFTLVDLVEAHGGIVAGKGNTIITFLAVLEMTKFKLLQIHQAAEDGQIYISPILENLNTDEDFVALDDYDQNDAEHAA